MVLDKIMIILTILNTYILKFKIIEFLYKLQYKIVQIKYLINNSYIIILLN